jgi:hypothetical protein
MLVLLVVAAALSFDARVDAELAVERARYAFVINANKPFDEVYPRAVFEKRVRQQETRERALKKVYSIELTESQLADELARIERSTRAPEQWQAVKKALGGEREKILEIVCRPLLVERVLRGRFDQDRQVHAAEHQKAREARAAMIAGRAPEAARVVSLTSSSESGPGVDEMLAKAKSEASGPRVLKPAAERDKDAPFPAPPELMAVLEKELKKPGDVTTILEDRQQFQVFRLVERQGPVFKLEAVNVPKRSFDAWLSEVGAGY